MTRNPIAAEPVLTSVLASVLVWVGARYAVKVDPQQASEAAGVVLLIAGAFARQLVSPTAKLPPDQPPAAAPAPPASPGPSKVGMFDPAKDPPAR